MARDNGLAHLVAPEFRGARHLGDLAAAVLTVESYLTPGLARQPGVEQRILRQVAALFPTVPDGTP